MNDQIKYWNNYSCKIIDFQLFSVFSWAVYFDQWHVQSSDSFWDKRLLVHKFFFWTFCNEKSNNINSQFKFEVWKMN